MKKRGTHKVLGILITLVVTAAVLHTAAHFALYGTGIPGVAEQGVSGFAIGSITGEQIKENYIKTPSLSKILILGEWILLIVLVIASLVGDKIRLKKQHTVLQIKKSTDKSKTDIDVLYDVLKEKKKVSLGTIAETFSVKEEIATEWVKILEDADLVTINYPRFGEPEVQIKE